MSRRTGVIVTGKVTDKVVAVLEARFTDNAVSSILIPSGLTGTVYVIACLNVLRDIEALIIPCYSNHGVSGDSSGHRGGQILNGIILLCIGENDTGGIDSTKCGEVRGDYSVFRIFCLVALNIYLKCKNSNLIVAVDILDLTVFKVSVNDYLAILHFLLINSGHGHIGCTRVSHVFDSTEAVCLNIFGHIGIAGVDEIFCWNVLAAIASIP